jgi:hypothetical protein
MIPSERFMKHVHKSIDPVGCWWWTGSIMSSGYGHFKMAGGMVGSHRASWQLAFGPIPEGLFVLHHCDNQRCVNPEHLFLGTHADNVRDCVAKGRHNQTKKMLCSQGHPYSAENTYIDTIGRRSCRECHRIRGRRSYAEARRLRAANTEAGR